jgi:hypothetical protein
MNLAPNDVVRILAAGGGVILDGSRHPVNDLVRFAAAAATGGCFLILQKSGSQPVNDLVRIASAGQGRVIFQG